MNATPGPPFPVCFVGTNTGKQNEDGEEQKQEMLHLLDSGGNLQAPDTWCGKLARVYVRNFPHSSVHVFQVLSLHDKDGLSWVEVELE